MFGQAIFAIKSGPILCRVRGQEDDLAARFHQLGNREAAQKHGGSSEYFIKRVYALDKVVDPADVDLEYLPPASWVLVRKSWLLDASVNSQTMSWRTNVWSQAESFQR